MLLYIYNHSHNRLLLSVQLNCLSDSLKQLIYRTVTRLAINHPICRRTNVNICTQQPDNQRVCDQRLYKGNDATSFLQILVKLFQLDNHIGEYKNVAYKCIHLKKKA